MSEEIARRLGQLIRQRRKRRRLTQWIVADLANVSQTSLSLLERGKRIPSLARLIKIADAIGLEHDDREAVLNLWLETELVSRVLHIDMLDRAVWPGQDLGLALIFLDRSYRALVAPFYAPRDQLLNVPLDELLGPPGYGPAQVGFDRGYDIAGLTLRTIRYGSPGQLDLQGIKFAAESIAAFLRQAKRVFTGQAELEKARVEVYADVRQEQIRAARDVAVAIVSSRREHYEIAFRHATPEQRKQLVDQMIAQGAAELDSYLTPLALDDRLANPRLVLDAPRAEESAGNGAGEDQEEPTDL